MHTVGWEMSIVKSPGCKVGVDSTSTNTQPLSGKEEEVSPSMSFAFVSECIQYKCDTVYVDWQSRSSWWFFSLEVRSRSILCCGRGCHRGDSLS